MKKMIVILLVIVIIVFSLMQIYEFVDIKMSAKNLVKYNGYLKVDGTQIKNQFNEPIILKGVSSHGIQWFPKLITKETLTTLKDDWGINVFRIAMYTEENGYIADKSLKKKVIEIIDNCIELDLYVIVDWHILSDGNPNKHIEDAKVFFDEISKKYKDKPNLIYEICNEPNGNKSTWNDDIVPYANTIIPIIRGNSPKSLIIVGTPEWSKDLKSVVKNKLEYKNILYSCHFYAGTHGKEVMSEIDNAIKNNIPVIISEWGTSTLTGGGGFFLENSQEWMKFLDERNISWINWSFSNADESSALLKGNNINLNNINENLSESGRYIKSIINTKK